MSENLTESELELKTVRMTKEVISCSAKEGMLLNLAGKYMKKDGLLAVWLVNRICFGRWQNGSFSFPDEEEPEEMQVLEIRMFNEEEELHLYREGDAWKGRYILDEGTEEKKCVDSMARLFGENKFEPENGYVTLKDEGRKISLTVPVEENSKHYGLITRNYVYRHPRTGQAGYEDYRFYAIVPAKGGKNDG